MSFSGYQCTFFVYIPIQVSAVVISALKGLGFACTGDRFLFVLLPAFAA